jgi:hypothetical protein
MQTTSPNQDPIEDSVKQAETINQIVPARNWALRIWLLIVVLVLGLLWFETRDNSGKDYNLLLNGDSNTIDAQVFIDGKPSGTMTRSRAQDLGGGTFWVRVADGRHLVDVQKKGFRPFRHWITIRGQGYLGVELVPKQEMQPELKSDPDDPMDLID